MLRICITFVVLLASGVTANEPIAFKKVQVSKAYFAEGAGYGDFNHDKKMDVVCGPFWYEGPDFKKQHKIYDGKSYPNDRGYSDCFFTFGYDFNSDGLDDVLTISFPGRSAQWFENPKASGQAWKKHIAFPAVDIESPAFLDVTGDGQPEIICSHKKQLGYAAFDKKDPTKPWKFTAVSAPGPWIAFSHGLGIGDVNGDGRTDFLTALGWLEQPKDAKPGTLWKPHIFKFCPGGAQMFAYDVDGDGDNDVITSKNAHAYGLSWFENEKNSKGEITFTEHLIMGNKPEQNRFRVAFSQLHAMRMHDMDGDGLKDIVTGKCYWAHNGHDPGAKDPAVIYCFKLVRKDKKAEFIPIQIDNDSGVGRQVSIGDVNGDKKPDVVVANKKGIHALIQVNATKK